MIESKFEYILGAYLRQVSIFVMITKLKFKVSIV
jgi:hypothetical protein